MNHFSPRQIAVAGLLGALTIAMGLLPVGGFIPVPTPAGSATTMHIPTILAGIIEGPVVGAIVGFIFGAFSFWRAQVQANPVARALFTDPLIAFVPRMLIGVVAHYAYRISTGNSSRIAASAGVGITGGYTVYSALNHLNTLHTRALETRGVETSLTSMLSPLTGSPAFNWGFAVIVGGFLALATHRVLKSQNSGPAVGALLGTATNTAGVLGFAVLRGYLPAAAAWAVAILHGLPEMLVATALVVLIMRGLERTGFIRGSAR